MPRTRSTNPDLQVAAAQAPLVEPPIALSAEEQRAFVAVISEKPRIAWTPQAIDTAVLLAKAVARCERLEAAGDYKTLNQTLNVIISLRRSLGIHSLAVEGQARKAQPHNAKLMESQSGPSAVTVDLSAIQRRLQS